MAVKEVPWKMLTKKTCNCLPGVDFIKVGRTAQIIEIALSICLDLCSTPTPNFYATKSFLKVGGCALRRAPKFMKLTSGVYFIPVQSWVFFICALRLRPIFMPQKDGLKAQTGL